MKLIQMFTVLTAAGVLFTASAEKLDLSTPPAAEPIEVEQSTGESKSDIRSRRIMRIALGTLTGAMVGLGYHFNSESNDRYNEYLALPEGDSRDAKLEDVKSAERARNVFYTLGAGSAIGFTFTFMF